MNIHQKLALCKRPNVITLIADGLFVYAYNESAYVVNGLLGLPFKVNSRVYKELGDDKVVYCGFPKSRIFHYFKYAKETAFGYEVIGDFSYIYYRIWHQQQTVSATRCGKRARAL